MARRLRSALVRSFLWGSFCFFSLCHAGRRRFFSRRLTSGAGAHGAPVGLAGPSDLRATQLAAALARDPNFAPARWQSGYVKHDGKWKTLDEIAASVATDKQLAAYHKKREGLIDTADNHRELARWCHKNKLMDEEARFTGLRCSSSNPPTKKPSPGWDCSSSQTSCSRVIKLLKRKNAAESKWQPCNIGGQSRRNGERRSIMAPVQIRAAALESLGNSSDPAARFRARKGVFASTTAPPCSPRN